MGDLGRPPRPREGGRPARADGRARAGAGAARAREDAPGRGGGVERLPAPALVAQPPVAARRRRAGRPRPRPAGAGPRGSTARLVGSAPSSPTIVAGLPWGPTAASSRAGRPARPRPPCRPRAPGIRARARSSPRAPAVAPRTRTSEAPRPPKRRRAPRAEGVREGVGRPAPAGGGGWHRLPGPGGPRGPPRRRPTAGPSSSQGRRSDAVARHDALALEHRADPPAAEAPPPGRDRAHARGRAPLGARSGPRASRPSNRGRRPRPATGAGHRGRRPGPTRRQARREPRARGPASPVTGRRPPRGPRRRRFPERFPEAGPSQAAPSGIWPPGRRRPPPETALQAPQPAGVRDGPQACRGALPAWRARPGAGLWRSPRHLEGLRRAISACSVSRIAQPTTSRACGARGRPRGGAGPHRSRMSVGPASRARPGRAASKPRPSRPGARAIGRPWRLSGAPAAGRAARPRQAPPRRIGRATDGPPGDARALWPSAWRVACTRGAPWAPPRGSPQLGRRGPAPPPHA